MFWNQAAKLHLFQLGNGGGGDADDDDADDDAGAGPRWSADEMPLFHAALAEHGKDFNLVAQRVSDPIVFFCFTGFRAPLPSFADSLYLFFK